MPRVPLDAFGNINCVNCIDCVNCVDCGFDSLYNGDPSEKKDKWDVPDLGY